jgi:hypothetical protein
MASLPGSDYNVLAGTITYLGTIVEGVHGVVQEADMAGGVDQDTIEEIRERLLEYVRNIGRATRNALMYRARNTSGVKYVSLKENPDGWLTVEDYYNRITYTGAWSEETGSFRYGEAKFSDTATAEVSIDFEGTKVQPLISGGGIVDCYMNEVFVESITEPKIFETTFSDHNVFKMVLRSGDLYVDGFELYSPYKRNAENIMHVDDGTGTASWTLMATLRDDLETAWKACGTYLHLSRSELELIDLEINVEWEAGAKTIEVKAQAEADIATWLSRHAPGSTIRMCNVIPIVLPLTVGGIRQVKCCSVVTPNITLDYDKVPRINTVVWNEYY